MTIQEVIAYLEPIMKSAHLKRYKEALMVAIDSLKEKVKREKGCQYCIDAESIYHRSSEVHDSMDEDVYISGNALVVDIGCHSYGSVGIKFCPMCGRRFAEPKEDESCRT